MKKLIILNFVFLFCASVSLVQAQRYSVQLKWNTIQIDRANGTPQKILSFQDASYEEGSDLPVFYKRIPVAPGLRYQADITHIRYEPVFDESMLSKLKDKAKNQLAVKTYTAQAGKETFLIVEFLPFVKDPASGFINKVVSFDIRLRSKGAKDLQKGKKYAENSVLAQGDWYKISVNNTGIYKLTYSDLQSLGIAVSSINPQQLKIYGNGGGMLPEDITAPRYDDLQENAIYVYGEEDGVFNEGDYILFYGKGPDTEMYSLDGNFSYQKNIYTGEVDYFITVSEGAGKRIGIQAQSTAAATYTVNSYDYLYHHESEEYNLNRSGKMWVGEKFDFTTSYEFPIDIPNLDLNSPVELKFNLAAQSKTVSQFSFYINNSFLTSKTVSKLPGGAFGDVGTIASGTKTFDAPGNNFTLKIEYIKPLSTSVGYLDFFSLKTICHLQFGSGQLPFRSIAGVGEGNVSQFEISTANPDLRIWDVSDPLNVQQQDFNFAGGKAQFKLATNHLHEFVAFDGSAFLQAGLIGNVPNQNLHAVRDKNMIIISYPDFVNQAERLANFHATKDNFSTAIVTPQQIYNEFSNGVQDVTAIRDFLKMVFDNSISGTPLQYVLLFGDASYDYKGILYPHANLVPVWENADSPMSQTVSYATDDFFAQLTDDDLLDISLGRFPVNTPDEAKDAVDKTFNYVNKSKEVFGDWRNVSCLIADDEEGGLFVNQCEELADIIAQKDSTINIDKIYLDAYQQEATPSGQRYKDVEDAISRRLSKGTLILNYVGHGGEAGWAHERIVKISDIANWDNTYRLPLFITATCELTRFDNPGRLSAGELMFTNPKGGAIALYTTTRPTFGGANHALSKRIYTNALQKFDGEQLSMGEVLRKSKNNTKKGINSFKYVFVGDPAIKLALPGQKVNVTEVSVDTIKALAYVQIHGNVSNEAGDVFNDFNGEADIKVFDKFVNYKTLGNDPNSPIETFQEQDHVIYNGKASVINGKWQVDFIVPKDIIYAYGMGKISLYAHNDEFDAAGYQDIVVGGIQEGGIADDTPPEVQISINDWLFENGGVTNENPIMLAKTYDESGINTSGSGIGHNLELTLDNTKTFVVNDFYETELNDFTHGHITYPLYGLSDGPHTMTLRVWDVFNNSNTASIDFIVVPSQQMAIKYLMNYPNPFSYAMGTHFSFQHNQSEDQIDVELQIYSTSGRLVNIIKDFSEGGNYVYKSGAWDGKDMNGNLIKSGTYIYKLVVRNAAGKYETATSKLVYIR